VSELNFLVWWIDGEAAGFAPETDNRRPSLRNGYAMRRLHFARKMKRCYLERTARRPQHIDISEHQHIISEHQHIISEHQHIISEHQHVISEHQHIISAHQSTQY